MRTAQEKKRDWLLGLEGERWIQKLFVASGFQVKRLNPPFYFEDRLVHLASLSEREKHIPDFAVSNTKVGEVLVDAKYRANGILHYSSIETQLQFYPSTKYVVVSDCRKEMFRAIRSRHIRMQVPRLESVPIEFVWTQIKRKARLRLEEEMKDTQPFQKIRQEFEAK